MYLDGALTPPRLTPRRKAAEAGVKSDLGKPRLQKGNVLRILLTNAYLSDRGGSELYIRDLAAQLRRRGHRPVAYSTILGDVAAELRALAVPVIDDLRALTEAPDVIHGQHILDAAAACLRFPQTPAVYACHGWQPWLETPLVLASVRRYVAVSELTRDRLVTSGVSPERVAVIPNFVDLERFPNRRDPRFRIKRALVYGNKWRPDSPAFLAIREACVRRGFDIEGVGYGFARPTDRPHDLLPTFDVVFALGRSALEAMACGCAVILAGPEGFGGAVSRQNFHQLQAANFGVAILAGQSVTADRVGDAVDRYDAAEVSGLADLVRTQSGVSAAVDRWEEQYRLAIAEGPAPLTDVVADASAYLVNLKALTFHFEHDCGRLAEELSALSGQTADLQAAEAECRRLQAELVGAEALRGLLATAELEREHALARLAAVELEREHALARLAAVDSHNAALSSWAAELQAKVTRLETPIRKRLGRKIRDAIALGRAWP